MTAPSDQSVEYPVQPYFFIPFVFDWDSYICCLHNKENANIQKLVSTNGESPILRDESPYSAPLTARSQALNSGTRALEMMIRSGVSTRKLSERRLPNQTEISSTALRATIN